MDCVVNVIVENVGMRRLSKGFLVEEDTIENMSREAIEQMKQHISKNKKRNDNPIFNVSTIQKDGKLIFDNRR